MADDVILTGDDLGRELQSLSGWEVRDGWLRRTYTTPGWPHTLMLVNTIGYIAESSGHHPDLSVGYAQVTVKLQTHRVKAITTHDTTLARKIDEVVLWKPEAGSPLTGYPKRWVH
ncbi:MAG: 4a-hydroxytetrahydrobiopterin dehydratase [Planctomycetales bacterium]|nr:4a-hydroxytetrahydrobiopterin dehydratase [Planctomycetales bacterium]